MPLGIRAIDLHDETALRAWWEVGKAATAERPGNPFPAWEVSRTALPADNPERDTTLYGAFDGDTMVGAVLFLMPLNENLHSCGFDLYVLPSRRREGIGSALVAHLETRATEHGRTTLQCEGYVPPGETGSAELFAKARGYEVASREGLKELRLADYADRREELVADVGTAADDYAFVTFDTVCPEAHLVSFGRLLGMLIAEIPLGDLDLEDSEWTPERLRAAEQRCVTIGWASRSSSPETTSSSRSSVRCAAGAGRTQPDAP